MKTKKHILAESVLEKDLPEDILQSLLRNATALGNNPAIPDIFDEPYLLKAARHEFETAKNELKSIGSIDADGNTPKEVLSSLLLKCRNL